MNNLLLNVFQYSIFDDEEKQSLPQFQAKGQQPISVLFRRHHVTVISLKVTIVMIYIERAVMFEMS